MDGDGHPHPPPEIRRVEHAGIRFCLPGPVDVCGGPAVDEEQATATMDGDGHPAHPDPLLDFPKLRGFVIGICLCVPCPGDLCRGQAVDEAQAESLPVELPCFSEVNLNRTASSSRKTGSDFEIHTAVAGTTTRVRQSVLYSNRPRRSARRRGQELLPKKLPVEEHAGEVSSSESPTIEVLPEFTALALNDMGPKLQLSPSWSNFCADDTSSCETDSEIVEEKQTEEESDSDFDLEKEERLMEEYFQENTWDTFTETCSKLRDIERATLAAKYEKMPAAQRADLIARAPYVRNKQLAIQAKEQALREEASMQVLLRRQPRGTESLTEIIENAKNWMSKEVMVAFDKYIERSATLKGLDCQLEELCHQCFSVENYCKIFHHFNFTVKIKNPSSSDSRVSLFFAEVKEIFGRKYYFCSPLEQSENGQCYACSNQGVNDLRHPATGGYDRGSTGTAFPFMYMDDSD